VAACPAPGYRAAGSDRSGGGVVQGFCAAQRRYVNYYRKTTYMNFEVTRLSLENEMDLVLGHKRSIRLGGMLSLFVASQTSFTTAISECCREVLERTRSGLLIVTIARERDK